MALGYIRKHRTAGDVEWRAILGFLEIKREVTAKEVSLEFSLGKEILTREYRGSSDRLVERKRHTGASEASVRLNRLVDWGMARRVGENPASYEITDYGKKVSANPSLGEAHEKAAKVKRPKGQLVQGPVTLMRVREISAVEEIRLPLGQLAVERKFDGWLVQVAGGRIYTRRGIPITENFPPISQAVSGWREEHLIGELVYWTPEGKMDEPTVTRVANVKNPRVAAERLAKLPGTFQIILFDLLARGGEDITDRPLEKRRLLLEKLVRPTKHIALSPIHPAKAWKEVFKEAIELGGEGVVFKNLQSPYLYRELGEKEPQPSGVWWKLKLARTDDFIVWNLSFSEKEKVMLHFGQLWQGQVIKVGEVNNLSREMEEILVKLLLEGPFVVELEFQERFRGYPGTLRDPRFKRLRPDKPIESVQLPKEHAP